MRLLFAIFILSLPSCSNHDFDHDSLMLEPTEIQKPKEILEITENLEGEYWICHHPDTEFHNQPCIEKEYPSGCFVKGDFHKFCWLMAEEDCETPVNRATSEACLNVGFRQE
jgi:hypothetical protein